jgi:hypothetical protein
MKKSKIERTKLFRIVQNCMEFDRAFKPTISDCREIFRNINRNVFNNELKMPKFRLVESEYFWGECVGTIDDPTQCLIRMNKRFLSKRLFVYTMAHEMVHQWEYLVYENMTHGPKFFQWRDELAKYNIVLSRAYRIRHYKLD